MSKNKSYYSFSYIRRNTNMRGEIITKWELIKRFISFLRNPSELLIKISKVNNVLIFQNQTWEYDKEKEDYVLITDLRGKENKELGYKDKYIE